MEERPMKNGKAKILRMILLNMVIAAALLIGGCGGDGGGTMSGDSTALDSLVSVAPLFSINGAGWNDYVQGDVDTATDVACDPEVDTACLHAGEVRVVDTGRASCVGLSASDALGAFNWVCDDSAGTARFISTGLAEGKNLSDLLDFSTPGWRRNSVTVYDNGAAWGKTPSESWWANPVAVANDGGLLDTEGTIYVITSDALVTGYMINGSSIGLVAKPGVVVNGPGLGQGSNVISAFGSTAARDFLWIEGEVDATGDDYGIYLDTVRFSALRNVRANNATNSGVYLYSSNSTVFNITASNNASNGIYLDSATNNRLFSISATNNGRYGVYLGDSSNNRLSEVKAGTNGNCGVYFASSSDNTLSAVTASNNGVDGVRIHYSSNNTLSSVTASNNINQGLYLTTTSDSILSEITATNNGSNGVYLTSSSNHNSLSGITSSNNGGYGVYLNGSSNNTLSGITTSNNGAIGISLFTSSDYTTLSEVTAANNGSYGISVSSSSNGTFSGITAANNGAFGIVLTSSSNNYFTGLLQVGTNGVGDCKVSLGGNPITNPGLDDDANPADVESDTVNNGLCIQQGASDFGTAVTGITLADSFAGKVTSDDSRNTSDTSGTASYPADPAVFDWTNFENSFRGWGLDGIFGEASSRGQWTAGTGRIWDWSLPATDTVVRGVLAKPTGDDTLTQTWSTTIWPRPATFLRHAVEIQGDGIGNDDLLCESGETCLYTPNMGSYQGHGALVSAGPFTDGTLTGITLLRYEYNGR
jgi:parallel beta-helix repeat protein